MFASATTAVALAFGALAGGASAAGAGTAAATTTKTTRTIVASEDAYVSAAAPTRNTGAESRVFSAAAAAGGRKSTYLKFSVPATPAGSVLVDARLDVTRATTGALSTAGLHVRSVADTAWTERTLTWSKQPSAGRPLTTGRLSADSKTLGFDIDFAVRRPGTYSFAVTAGAGSLTAYTKEAGASLAPRLVLTYEPLPARPLFGGVVQPLGETYTQTFNRLDAAYGGFDVTRVFFPGLPGSWDGPQLALGARPTVVSFKMSPQDVIAGKHDAFFTKWFAAAPTGRTTWWSYYHEPEDNIEAGTFTAAQYRQAWQRLRTLSLTAKNPSLKSSLILMCYSVLPGSKRNWLDYYPGDTVVDNLGWDCYNAKWDDGQYVSPETRFRPLVTASRSVGKPWGMAEVGSVLAVGDVGTGRAAWLQDMATWMHENGAEYVTYFDANIGVEYRLLDEPSRTAWRSVVAAG